MNILLRECRAEADFPLERRSGPPCFRPTNLDDGLIPERLHPREVGLAARVAVVELRRDPLRVHDAVEPVHAGQQAGHHQHRLRAAGLEVADLLGERVGHARGAQALRHRLRPAVGERDHQRALRARHHVAMRAGRADAAVHAEPVLQPGRPHRARQRGAGRAGRRDRDAGRVAHHQPLAGVAIVGRGVQPGRGPGVAADHALHRPGVARGVVGVARRHRRAADGADRGRVGVGRLDGDPARALLALVGVHRRHQLGEDPGELAEDVELGLQPPQPPARQHRTGQRARRRADDHVRRREVDAALLQRVEVADHPRNQVDAAAAQHERTLLPLAGRRRVGDRMREAVVPGLRAGARCRERQRGAGSACKEKPSTGRHGRNDISARQSLQVRSVARD